MNAYIISENGYIQRVEAPNCGGGQKITEAEYNAILAVIRNRPTAEGKGYRLKTDLTWEAYDLPPEPEPSDADELSDAQALNMILGVTA